MNMMTGKILQWVPLALIILFDQFSRNMFRDDKKAFEQDTKARLIVSDAVHAGFLEEMDQ